MIEGLYSLLKSLGYDHPLHPMLVHMPIGLIAGAVVFFVVAIVFKRKQLVPSARHASILALVFAVPTILLGVFDWMHFYHAAMVPAIVYKMFLSGAVLVLLGLGIILGGEAKIRNWIMTLVYALAFVAAIGLGWFGGNLVYGQAWSAAAAPQIGVAEASSTPAAAPTSGASDGKAIFEGNCASCHPDGGNIIEAKLPVRGSKRLASLGDFTAFVRKPVMPDGKAGPMPPFDDDALGGAEIQALYAYAVKTFKK